MVWSLKKILTKFKTHPKLNIFFTPFNKDSVAVCTCSYRVMGNKSITCSDHQNHRSSARVTPTPPIPSVTPGELLCFSILSCPSAEGTGQ